MRIAYPGILYDKILYPAGELQIRMRPETFTSIHGADAVEIDARVKSAEDLIGLILLSDAIRGVKPGVHLSLNIPYLPYARADRRFTEGDCFGLETFGRLLRVGNFDEINTLDVHSAGPAFTHVSSFLRNYPAMPFINRAILDFKPDAILYPDKGAAHRYPCSQFYSIFATKERDPATGRLSGFTVPDVSRYGRILIVDDICDGGGTFLGIMAAIPPGPTFGLYVTHGIFSKGVACLYDSFDHVYTTDSFQACLSVSGPTEQYESRGWFCGNRSLTVYDAFEAFRHAGPDPHTISGD